MLSKAPFFQPFVLFLYVLILVLMEYALEGSDGYHRGAILWYVLILVLMEYALEEAKYSSTTLDSYCLNPCFNGICSRRLIALGLAEMPKMS